MKRSSYSGKTCNNPRGRSREVAILYNPKQPKILKPVHPGRTPMEKPVSDPQNQKALTSDTCYFTQEAFQ